MLSPATIAVRVARAANVVQASGARPGRQARRRPWLSALTILAASALTGCRSLLFVQPLYLETETASDPRLLGGWTADGGTLTFSADGPGYDITFVDRSGSHEVQPLHARLVDLHGRLFLDLEDSADPCFG